MNNKHPESLKLITVEDSKAIAERIKTLISNQPGLEYKGNAGNLATAWFLIESHQPDIIILDIILEDKAPGQNGMALLSLVKKHYPATEVIMFSNLSSPIYQNQCAKLGATHFLDKSSDFEKIPEVISSILFKKATQ